MDLIKKVQTLLSYRGDRVNIDDLQNKLHYRVTAILLFICAVLVTSHQYIGDPIDCYARTTIPLERIDRYCWVQKTYSSVDHWRGEIGKEVAYPGVAEPNNNIVYHSYYQWVCFVLFIQSMSFYLPHRLWKMAEGGRVKRLVSQIENQLDAPSAIKDRLEHINRYLNNYRGDHRLYGLCFIGCELLNLFNVIIQLILLNVFLGGNFFNYGFDVINHSEWDQGIRFDPMMERFPRVTQCTIRLFGSSGSVQDFHAICFLHVNILNEKIFLVMWFWFAFLLLVTTLAILLRAMVVINVMNIRWLLIRTKDLGYDYSQKARAMTRRAEFGDFVLLHLLSKNLDRIHFSNILKSVIDSSEEIKLRTVETKSSCKERIVDTTCTKIVNGNHKTQHVIKRSSVTNL